MASYLVATQKDEVDGPLDHLRDLVRLRDAGVVTAEEFQAKSLDLVRRLQRASGQARGIAVFRRASREAVFASAL